MSKEEEVRSAMVQAMKAGDKERKESLSMLLQSLKKKRIDERRELTEEEENSIVLKEVKQMKESIDLTPKDRTDLIEQYTSRMNVFEEFAPKMMSEEEIQAVIGEVLTGLGIEKPVPSDKGRIMKELMPRVKGKADGKEVNRILGAMFS